MPRDKTTVRNVLAFMLLLAFQLSISALFRFDVPEGNRDMVTYMLGQLSGMAATVLAFFFSTSQASHDKNDIIAGLAAGSPKQVEVVNKPSDPIPVEQQL